MTTLILGGGIAGLSLAAFLDETSTILEKRERLGGLCQSYDLNGVKYDIGPHILFSKNQEVMDLHTSMIETGRIRRSNQIFHKKRFIKYPFENDLANLPPEDRDYCLREFLNNPYENHEPKNMLEFFLKTFGEGITRTYLQPYNEKIWKFDPSFMDTQMVERIPRPPREDVIKSAQGIPTEGYLHQLHFHYPKQGGFQTLVDAYAKRAREKAEIINPMEIESIRKTSDGWRVLTNRGAFASRRLVSCIPLHELLGIIEAPLAVRDATARLLYNSLHVVTLQVKHDQVGNHFALSFADKNVIFHRLSKLNYLGESYCLPGGGATLLAEITFRSGSDLASLDHAAIETQVITDLEAQGLVNKKDVLAIETRTFKYAYVIYDLDHRKNTDLVLNYLRSQGIESVGRFAEFEYLNSDQIVERTLRLAKRLNSKHSP